VIHVVLPPAYRSVACPFVQRTANLLRVLDILDEPYSTHGTEAWGWVEGDLIFYTYPSEPGYAPLVEGAAVTEIECGVAYDAPPCGPLRVYETEIWRHYCFAKYDEPLHRRRNSWVIPWAFDRDAWPLGSGAEKYVSFLGRLTPDKGIRALTEVARKLPSMSFKVASTDAVNGLWIRNEPPPSNIEFVGPVLGTDRAQFLGAARVHLCPTEFVESLCGSAIEAMLCGTPVVTSNYGGFVETVDEGVTGFRCASVDEMVESIKRADEVERARCQAVTQQKFSIEAAVPRWRKALVQIRALPYTASKKNIQNSRAFGSSVPK
jgi:glycosyltransferase involved in cell wall biosynthesis